VGVSSVEIGALKAILYWVCIRTFHASSKSVRFCTRNLHMILSTFRIS